MTVPDVAMLVLTLAGFALIALLPYAAFRVVELAEDAIWRLRDRAERDRAGVPRVGLLPRTAGRSGAARDAAGRFAAPAALHPDDVVRARRDSPFVR